MLYPLKFRPILKQRIWGGDSLSTVLNKKLPAGGPFGESWEISGVDGDISVVGSGALKSNDLEELIEVYMGDLVGERIYEKYGLEFPLLIKLIDARDVLSIQVHPGDELAQKRHDSQGKTEMWYVIDCDPGASLYLGFKQGTTKEQYLAAVDQGKVSELLNRVDVHPGDAFFIPAGAVHAIGKGILIAEIQQTSDITYRVDDWGRVDAEGKPRQMHTELATDAIDFNAKEFDVTARPAPGQAMELKKCPYFTTNLLNIKDGMEREYIKFDSFVILIAVEGDFKAAYSGGTVPLKKGESLLIPACEEQIALSGTGKILEVYIE